MNNRFSNGVLAVGVLVSAACAFSNSSNAQAKALTEIGKTSAGTPVMLETKSVSRANGIVTATLRVALQPPIKTSQGDMMTLRSISMIDCAKQMAATKERWFYFDAKYTKEARHDKPGIPGYGPAIKGSLPDVAIKHFCTATPK